MGGWGGGGGGGGGGRRCIQRGEITGSEVVLGQGKVIHVTKSCIIVGIYVQIQPENHYRERGCGQ